MILFIKRLFKRCQVKGCWRFGGCKLLAGIDSGRICESCVDRLEHDGYDLSGCVILRPLKEESK